MQVNFTLTRNELRTLLELVTRAPTSFKEEAQLQDEVQKWRSALLKADKLLVVEDTP